MPPNTHTFLFSSSEDISPLTSRRVHLRRLYDILYLSVQRGDLRRACRAWAILARCKEMDWKSSWTLAIVLLGYSSRGTESGQRRIDYLRSMMLHSPEYREPILCELVHLYVITGRHREALDELEFSLPSFPFRDNAVLHIYAGICSALACQRGSTSEAVNVPTVDSEMLDRAKIFFERAKSLDPENIVVDPLLGMIQSLSQSPVAHPQTETSDDEVDPVAEYTRVKRPRA